MNDVTRREISLDGAELRAATADGTRTFAGYAAVHNQWADIAGMFRERVVPGAFAKTLAEGADVRMLVNHEGMPIARTKSGTLRLAEDDHGLHVEAALDSSNPKVQELSSAMDRGDLSQMSFGFRTIEDLFDEKPEDGGLPTRDLREVSLKNGDVSPVTFPAYEGTTAAIRAEARAYLAEHGVTPPLTYEEVTFEDVLAVIARSTPETGWDGDPEAIRAAIMRLESFVLHQDEPTTDAAPAGHSLELIERQLQVTRNRLRLLGVA